MKVKVELNQAEYLSYLDLLRRAAGVRSRVPEALNSAARKGYQEMVDVIGKGTSPRTGALSSPVITYANIGSMRASISPNPAALHYAAYQDEGTRGPYQIPKVVKTPPKLLVSTWPPGTIRVLGFRVMHPGVRGLGFTAAGAESADAMLMVRINKILDEAII